MWTTALSLMMPVLAAALAGQDQSPRALMDQGRFDEAEAAARIVAGASSGPEALVVLAEALILNGRIASGDAESAARRAADLSSEQYGRTSPEAAHALTVLGAALLAQGAPHAAAPVIDQAVEILRPRGRSSAAALALQAEVRLEQGEPASSLDLVEAVLSLLRTEGPEDPALVLRVLDAKALALQHLGRWSEAAAVTQESQERGERLLPRHPQRVITGLLAGDAGWRSGDMATAGSHYARAVSHAERTLRTGHPLRTRAQGRLASWLAETGQLERALPLHRSTLKEARENLGPRHPRVADYVNDLANALVYAGDPDAAVGLFEEAVRLAEAIYGPDATAVATPLYNLGWALSEQRRWVLARAPLERALGLWRSKHGSKDARVLLVYGTLADALAGDGRDAAAIDYYQRALSGRLEAGEHRHPATASLRAHLAAALERLGRYDEAARSAGQAADGLRELAGWGDREYAEVQALRARLALRRGKGGQTILRLAVDADDAMRRHVRKTVRFLAESQALDYVGQRFGGRDAVLSLLGARPGDVAAARAGLDLVARSRNVVLDEMAERAARAPAEQNGRPARAAAEHLATLLYRGVAGQGPEGEAAVRKAQADADAAAREDALTAALEPPAQRLEPDLVDGLARRLAPGEALVSFCAYRAVGDQGRMAYIALVLRPHVRGPVAVGLGDAAEIDDLIRRWHSAMQDLVRSPGSRPVRKEVAELGRRLGARIWTPLQRPLRGTRRVTLVPDGHLHLVNFAALLDSAGRYVVESGQTLHVVSAERDLLREPPQRRAQRMLLVADPSFDEAAALLRAPLNDAGHAPGSTAAPSVHRGASPCAEVATLKFAPLPASRLEAEDLRALWRARTGDDPELLTGSAAAEGRVKQATAGRTIVHIASHGFVLDNACLGSGEAGPGAGTPRYSPLLLAGIALAGANSRHRPDADDDGILTAAEVAGLDLREADWVVLSGCDTGRGEVRASEGVLGLQRALFVAGARTVVMSLWSVDDQDARAFMAELYHARFNHGRDTADAIRDASLAIIRRLRKEGVVPDPSRWAAFVAVGDPR
jgi:CHAT domain-containing protein/tetratricopeptide (TPR) repeat protein